MRNEGDDDRTSGQVLGEQRWTVRGRIVGMRGSRIAKLLVVAPSQSSPIYPRMDKFPGEQRWTVRGRIVGMRGSRIAKLLVGLR